MRPRHVLAASLLGMTAAALLFAAGFWSATRMDTPAGATPGPADIGFARDMATHHQQAVLMATMAMTRSTPAVRTIAQSILTSQSKQIGMMRGWLQSWGVAQVSSAPPMSWYPDQDDQNRSHPKQTMEGMASAKQLARLWHASGKAFDVLFMQLMTRHHEGGVLMARAAQQTAHLKYVRMAARGMIFQQAQEIAEMKARLKAEGHKPLPSLLKGK